MVDDNNDIYSILTGIFTGDDGREVEGIDPKVIEKKFNNFMGSKMIKKTVQNQNVNIHTKRLNEIGD